MKLTIRIYGAESELELFRIGANCRFRLGSQAEQQAEVHQPEPDVYSVLLDGRSYEARVEQGGGRLLVVVDGQRFEIEVRDPRRYRGKAGGIGMEGLQNLTAPMPGKVVRLLVKTGDPVRAGQGLLVVEAMKMQNEMKAARGGRVVSLRVREGDAVSAGEVLATIE